MSSILQYNPSVLIHRQSGRKAVVSMNNYELVQDLMLIYDQSNTNVSANLYNTPSDADLQTPLSINLFDLGENGVVDAGLIGNPATESIGFDVDGVIYAIILWWEQVLVDTDPDEYLITVHHELLRSINRGISFSSQRIISGEPTTVIEGEGIDLISFPCHPQLFVGVDGSVYCFYVFFDEGTVTIFCKIQSGAAFGSPVELVESANTTLFFDGSEFHGIQQPLTVSGDIESITLNYFSFDGQVVTDHGEIDTVTAPTIGVNTTQQDLYNSLKTTFDIVKYENQIHALLTDTSGNGIFDYTYDAAEDSWSRELLFPLDDDSVLLSTNELMSYNYFVIGDELYAWITGVRVDGDTKGVVIVVKKTASGWEEQEYETLDSAVYFVNGGGSVIDDTLHLFCSDLDSDTIYYFSYDGINSTGPSVFLSGVQDYPTALPGKSAGTFRQTYGLLFLNEPEDSVIDGELNTLQVQVGNTYRNTVPTADSTIFISLLMPDGAMISGTRQQRTINGIAEFSELSINQPGTYTLTAVSGTLIMALSAPFTIAGAKTSLAFTTQPQEAAVDETLEPVTVWITDSEGRRVTNATDSVTISLTVPAGATLSGTLTKSATNGIVVFDDLSVDQAGDFTLTVTATGLSSAESDSFTINSAGILVDFSGETIGVIPPGWTERWQTGGWTVQGSPSEFGDRVLRWQDSTGFLEAALSLDLIDGSGDIELLSLIQFSNISSLNNGLIVRGSGTNSSDWGGYGFWFNSGNSVLIMNFDGGSTAPLANPSFSHAANTWYWTRFRVEGEDIKLRIWEYETPEPGTWFFEGTDSTHASGWAGVTKLGDLADNYWDVVSVALNGASAPFPPGV